MRVMYSHYLPKFDQPAGHMIRAISDELRELGHEVLIHGSVRETPGLGVASSVKGKRLSALRARLWFAKAIARDWSRARQDDDAIRRFRPDVLLVRQDPYCTSMTRAGVRAGVPVVTYADAPAACEARQRNGAGRWHPPGLVEMIEANGLARSEAVIAVSGPAAKVLGEFKLDVPIHVIPNGFRPSQYRLLGEPERRAKRLELGLTAPNVIAFQGTFQSFHGIGHLQQLMISTATRTDMQWLLIGDGPDKSGLEEAVRGKVPATFVGRQPSERVGELLGLVDVAVAPYSQVQGLFYGCPLKVLEYAAAGCAVIASHQGDIPELLDNGNVGIVLPTENHAAWTNALNSLCDNPTRRAALGQAAREWAHRRYTWGRCARQIQRVLEDAVRRFGGKSRTRSMRFSRGEIHEQTVPPERRVADFPNHLPTIPKDCQYA